MPALPCLPVFFVCLKEAFVPSSRLRPLPSFAVGAGIECNFGGQGTYYPGTVAAALGDGTTYDIAYDDGDRELRVLCVMLSVVL